MKRLMIGLFLIVLLAFSVNAIGVIDLGGKTSIEKTAKPTNGFSDTFIVKNNGTENITNLNLQLVTTELSRFNISTSPYSLNQQFTLNVNQQVSFTLTGTVPKDITTREEPYTGALKMYSGSTELGSINLKITSDSQLELGSVKFLVDSSSKSISDGDTRKEVKPGSKLEIKGDIENTFTDSDDIVIEDVTVDITIKDIDDGDDMEEDVDVGDIDPDDKENFEITFDIPEDVDADEYSVEILVEGEDENGAKHSVKWDVKIKVEKDKHDIVIRKATVSPSKISCSRRINLGIDLKNQGESDEDEVVVAIESSSLNIDNEDTSIPSIDEGTGEDTEYSKTYTFDVSDSVKAGTYPISVRVYYDTDTLSDSETVNLVVENCAAETPAEQKPSEVVVVNPPTSEGTETPAEEEPEIITTPVTETTEVPLLQSNTYLILLIGAVGVAVIVIIIMIVVLFSMKKRV